MDANLWSRISHQLIKRLLETVVDDKSLTAGKMLSTKRIFATRSKANADWVEPEKRDSRALL